MRDYNHVQTIFNIKLFAWKIVTIIVILFLISNVIKLFAYKIVAIGNTIFDIKCDQTVCIQNSNKLVTIFDIKCDQTVCIQNSSN